MKAIFFKNSFTLFANNRSYILIDLKILRQILQTITCIEDPNNIQTSSNKFHEFLAIGNCTIEEVHEK